MTSSKVAASSAATETSTEAKTKPSKRWQWFRQCSRVVIYLPLSLLVMLAMLIGTQFGAHITVKMADWLVPNLNITYQSGRINHQLTLAVGNWSMAGIKVETTDLMLDWNPMCLLQTQLCVNELSASKVNVEIDTGSKGKDTAKSDSVAANVSTEPKPLPPAADALVEQIKQHQEITLPFGIKLSVASLSHVTVRVNDMDFNAKQLNLSAEWQSTGIRAKSIYSEELLVSIPLQSHDVANTKANQKSISNQPNELISQQVTNSGVQPKPISHSPQVHTSGSTHWAMAQLPEVFMPIPVYVDALEINQGKLVLGSRTDFFEHISLIGSYQTFLINVEKLSLNHSYGDLTLQGQMSLTDDYPMDIALDANLNKVTELPGLLDQQLQIKLNQGFKQLKTEINGLGQFEFAFNSTIELAKPSLPYSLALKASQLHWPLDTPTLIATDIDLATNGDIAQQQVSLKTQFASPYHPLLSVVTEFKHQVSSLDFSQLQVVSEMGNVDLNGKLTYGDKLEWQTNVVSQQLNIGQLQLNLANALPTSLINGSFKTHGHFLLSDSQWEVGIEQANLNGVIADYPLTVAGGLTLNDQGYISSQGLNINALQSELNIQGQVNNRWALNGDLTVPDLSLWHRDARGEITSDIHVSGESKHPDVDISLTAVDLTFAQLSLAHLDLIGEYKPLDNQAFSAYLTSEDFHFNDMILDSIIINGQGDLNQQTLSLATTGELDIATEINSQYDNENSIITAKVEQLTIHSLIGDVSLNKPFESVYDFSQHTGKVAPLCLDHISGNLCTTEPIILGLNGNAKVQYTGDIGQLTKPWLPDSIDWQAPAKLASEFEWFAERKPIGRLELDLPAGMIDFSATNNSQASVGYQSLNISSQLNEQHLSTSVLLQATQTASLQANLAINVSPDRAIKGDFKLQQVNLHELAALIPQLEVLEGILSSNLRIGGTLNEPQASGDITLQQGSILAAANPTLVEDIALNLAFAGKKAQIAGELKMGDGLAYVNGDLDWLQQNLKGNFNIKGDNLAVIQPPLAILSLGTDVNINFTEDSLTVKGDIDVPTGEITIVQLQEGGVAVSKDVVFRDKQAVEVTKSTPLAVSAELNINIGDELRVEGMGLNGKLVGRLELKQDPFRPPLLYGEIKVIDGTYKFMGQTLAISAGELQFIGPMDVPSLNIEAAREIKDEDVTAGVRITGTPTKPVVSLYSSPTKEQAEILNYILRGTSLNSTDTDQNSGLLLGAALTLGNQVGGGTISNMSNRATGIIEKIGFSNVQLDANDDGRFAISGFIGDNLMVKYGVGVFNPGYEMTVRYYLLSQLYLETVSGTLEQSLDIYYNFDL
ncbi:translocation/assembly module TamB domain-containing protein [Shewanella youngdeokensis]|uniref:Translocation/assembly module TamB domain-containing protein n=1 Tax=Shewanella youngdeokensis TaxID=2999068 RepID=A0ABZ0JTX0_9GAMM|nr:translocation/assembly module TamB domain-containing protein [Shewanella sp. DAU334]